MKKYLFLALVIPLIFSLGFIYENNISPTGNLNWKATVCPTIIKSDGSIVKLECVKNLFVDQGKNFSAEVISGVDYTSATPGTDFAKYISLSNDSSTPSSSWTVLPGELNTAGLTRAGGTCASNGVGNFSCWHTFTATATVSNIQLAGLNWNGTPLANSLVAANQLSSSVNLESGDELIINWTVTIS